MAPKRKTPKPPEKKELPLGWIEVVSKKHPDRVFYFNKKSSESTWTFPSPTCSSTSSTDVSP